MPLRASSIGSGGSTRISSVCHSSSTASSSRRVRRGLSGWSSRAATCAHLLEVERRATSVGWAVNTGRTPTCGDLLGDRCRPRSAPRGRGPGRRAPSRSNRPPPARAEQRAPAVHLLGDVGEVEVRRERPRQLRGGLEVELRQPLEGVVLGQRPHLLDEVEQVLALGPAQRLAEHRGDQPDVTSQVGVRGAVGWIVHTSSIATPGSDGEGTSADSARHGVEIPCHCQGPPAS